MISRELQGDTFDVLVGLQLSIVRFAVDMPMFGFGTIRPTEPKHPGRKASIADYAFHVQCPWRIDGPNETIAGSGDLFVFNGPDEDEPEGWRYGEGSLLFAALAEVFGVRDGEIINSPYVITSTRATASGDVEISFSSGHTLRVFPTSVGSEVWRLFAPRLDSCAPSADPRRDHHLVFPPEEE